MSKQPVTCSPDERSDIRVRSASFMPLPDFASAYALCASADCTRRSSQSERRRVVSSGLQTLFTARFRQIKKGSGTPADAVVHDLYASGAQGAPRRRRLTPPFRFGRARLPAFHHGTCGSDRTPPLSSSSRASWDGTREGWVLPTPGRPSAAGVMSPQAGRRAGRAFWPGAARERG